MSTKTTFKRVALVAVAALGLGVLSVAPSQAANTINGPYVTPAATTASAATLDTATVKTTVGFVSLTGGESLTVQALITSAPTGGTTAVVGITAVDSTTNTSLSANISSAGGTTTLVKVGSKAAGIVKANVNVTLVSAPVAGTYVIGLFTGAYDAAAPGVAATSAPVAPVYLTITVKSASALADATTTSFIAAGAGNPGVTDSLSVSSVKTAGVRAATILVTENNVTGSAFESATVTITGPGTIATAATNSITATGARALTLHPGHYIGVFADGTAGTATITITGNDSGIVFGVETVNFYSSVPATAVATLKKAYPAAGTAATTSAVYVLVKDSLGNIVQNANVDLEPTTAGVGDTTTACAYSSTYSTNVCSLKGVSSAKFGKVTYRVHVTGADTDATEIYGNTFDVTFADTVATKVTVTAPATGNVGDKVTLTLTATEKNGYPVADASYEGAAGKGIFWNTTTVPVYSSSSFAPFNSGETITTLSGVATKAVYLPAVSGTVTSTWTLAGTAGAGVTTGSIDKTISGSTVAVTIAVTNPGVDAATDAANEATDAANAATDAALAAADAADAATAAAQDASDAVAALSATVATLVASLKAQLTSLTNLVIKIQKKVKA